MTAINPFIAYDNRFADATPVANNTAAGNYNAANLADMRPYTWWKPSGFIGYGQAVGVSVNCGAPKSADYAAIFGHDLFSNQCILAIDSSTDNFVANATNRATITPTDDNADLVQFTSASAQYWRIVLYRINQFNSLYQDDLGNAAYWAKTATVTPNTAVAPDGTTTSDTITDNSATVIQSVARTCDTYNVKKTYRASIDVLKDAVPAATRYCGLNIYFGGTSPENYAVVLVMCAFSRAHLMLKTLKITINHCLLVKF